MVGIQGNSRSPFRTRSIRSSSRRLKTESWTCLAFLSPQHGRGNYEVFAGNTADVMTVEQIVTTVEQRYGQSDCMWVTG